MNKQVDGSKDGHSVSASKDAVDGCGEQTGEGGAGNLVEKVLQQSLSKVSGKELKKTKPRIDDPVSQSPIPMKKVKLGGRQKKTTNFLSLDQWVLVVVLGLEPSKITLWAFSWGPSSQTRVIQGDFFNWPPLKITSSKKN